METRTETKPPDPALRQSEHQRDGGRPTFRRRLITGLLMAVVFGGAKWSQVPTADGVFWVIVMLGFAIGWSGFWL